MPFQNILSGLINLKMAIFSVDVVMVYCQRSKPLSIRTEHT